jgi:hypothetical protein
MAGLLARRFISAGRSLVSKWNERFADVIARKEPDWTERHPELAERHGPVADDAGRRIAAAWVRQIRAA